MDQVLRVLVQAHLVRLPAAARGDESAVRQDVLATLATNIAAYGYALSKDAFTALRAASDGAARAWWEELEPVLSDLKGANRKLDEHVVYKNFPHEVLSMSESEYWLKQILMYWGFPNELFTEEPEARAPIDEAVRGRVLHPAKPESLERLRSARADHALDGRSERERRDRREALRRPPRSRAREVQGEHGAARPRLPRARRARHPRERHRRAAPRVRHGRGRRSLPAHEHEAPPLQAARTALPPRAPRGIDEPRRRHGRAAGALQAPRPRAPSRRLEGRVPAHDRGRGSALSRPAPRHARVAHRGEARRPRRDRARRSGRAPGRIRARAPPPGAHVREQGRRRLREDAAPARGASLADARALPREGERATLPHVPAARRLVEAPHRRGGSEAAPPERGARAARPRHRAGAPRARRRAREERAAVAGGEAREAADERRQAPSVWTRHRVSTAEGRALRAHRFVLERAGSRQRVVRQRLELLRREVAPAGACCWDAMRFPPEEDPIGAIFSGDPTSSKDSEGRACQLIDLYLDVLASAGVRFAIWNVLGYSRLTFDDVPEVFAGLLWGEDPEKGALFDAARVQLAFPLRGKSLTKYVAMLDLAKRELVFLDANLRARTDSAHDNGKTLSKTIPAYLEYLDSLPSVHDLFAHATPAADGMPVVYSDRDAPIRGGPAWVFEPGNEASRFEPFSLAALLAD